MFPTHRTKGAGCSPHPRNAARLDNGNGIHLADSQRDMRTFRLGDASPLAVLVVAVTALGAVVVPPRANRGNDVAAAGDRLQPLRFLAGWRWQGTFPDSENVYDRAFIRDRHLVRSARPDYRGEIQYG